MPYSCVFRYIIVFVKKKKTKVSGVICIYLDITIILEENFLTNQITINFAYFILSQICFMYLNTYNKNNYCHYVNEYFFHAVYLSNSVFLIYFTNVTKQ